MRLQPTPISMQNYPPSTESEDLMHLRTSETSGLLVMPSTYLQLVDRHHALGMRCPAKGPHSEYAEALVAGYLPSTPPYLLVAEDERQSITTNANTY